MKLNKLQAGDEIRVIAPSRSMKIINEETRQVHIEVICGTVFRDPSCGRVHPRDAVPMALY